MNHDSIKIHDVLSNLRRRVTEIKTVDNLGSYSYAGDIITEIKANIERFSPEEIVKYMTPLLEDLTSISEDTYSLVTDETSASNWLNGLSPRESLKKEVDNYISLINQYIEKYSPLSTSQLVKNEAPIRRKLTVIRYSDYKRRSGRDKLRNLHIDLYDNYSFIERMEFREFRNIFSGREQTITNPINWIRDRNALRYFLLILFRCPSIVGDSGDKRINWVAVANCFRFNSEIIDPKKFKSNNSLPTNATIITRILRDF